jgi:tRNA/tmRNA/rRNA uracil-C5-methylase (TrmA/RlmC/RlmD family)
VLTFTERVRTVTAVAVEKRIEDAGLRASQNVPTVVRRFIRATAINQAKLGAAIGLGQQDLSYRLTHPRAFSYVDLARIAAFFNVTVDTLFKSEDEALADLFSGTGAKGAYLSSHAA